MFPVTHVVFAVACMLATAACMMWLFRQRQHQTRSKPSGTSQPKSQPKPTPKPKSKPLQDNTIPINAAQLSENQLSSNDNSPERSSPPPPLPPAQHPVMFSIHCVALVNGSCLKTDDSIRLPECNAALHLLNEFVSKARLPPRHMACCLGIVLQNNAHLDTSALAATSKCVKQYVMQTLQTKFPALKRVLRAGHWITVAPNASHSLLHVHHSMMQQAENTWSFAPTARVLHVSPSITDVQQEWDETIKAIHTEPSTYITVGTHVVWHAYGPMCVVSSRNAHRVDSTVPIWNPHLLGVSFQTLWSHVQCTLPTDAESAPFPDVLATEILSMGVKLHQAGLRRISLSSNHLPFRTTSLPRDPLYLGMEQVVSSMTEGNVNRAEWELWQKLSPTIPEPWLQETEFDPDTIIYHDGDENPERRMQNTIQLPNKKAVQEFPVGMAMKENNYDVNVTLHDPFQPLTMNE